MTKKEILERIILVIGVIVLVVIEYFCAKLAFETLSEIESGLYLFVVAFNIVPFILIISGKAKQIAMISVFVIALIIIPYQLYLGNKLISLKEEAANITAYLYEQKIEHHVFPQNISMYSFTFPNLKNHFDYRRESDSKFILDYFVGTKNTSHFYNSDVKKWGYYPD